MTIEHGPLVSPALDDTAASARTTARADWSAAIDERRGGPHHLPDAPPHPSKTTPPPKASRRAFLRTGFWAGIGLTLLGGLGAMVDYLYPRNVRGFGGPVPAGNVADYAPGAAPVVIREAQAYLVNLDPAEDRLGGSGGGAGLLALWQRCPHLGCTVPWNPTFSWQGDDGGWFRCPCHRSTYTRAGVLVEGPAPRSMDTMLIEVADDGAITIQSGVRQNGGPDNPGRALRV